MRFCAFISEALGRCIYEGFWGGEKSPIRNFRGIHSDVKKALKRIQIPVIRWAGQVDEKGRVTGIS